MQALVALLALFALACAQSEGPFAVTSTWTGADCTGDLVTVTSTFLVDNDCAVATCASLDDGSGANSQKVECFEDPTPYGSFGFNSITFNNTECTGDILGAASKATDICLNRVIPFYTGDDTGFNSTRLVCGFEAAINYRAENCEGEGFPANTIEPPPVDVPACTVTGDFSSTGSCGVVCFHEDTEILYQGIRLSLNELQSSSAPICSIPHIVKADGVKITTTCSGSLRLTQDHLVYTREGLKTAGSIKKGDVLFSDMEEKNSCEVTQVEQEFDQTYFGLNCEESEVLANGFKTSTFGIFHAVPAMWMKYASKVIGVKAASQLGDAVANALFKLNLL